MKASIIIPLYNQAEFVAKAIESALKQTHLDTEVVVVNDGSTDESLSVAKRYTQVKVVNQQNKGLAGARNAGVLNSTGEVLLPLDADDYIDARYLERTIPLMEKNVGIVSSDMQCFGIDTTRVRIEPTSLTQEMQANRLPVCSLIRREAFLETGGYNPRMAKGYEDWNLWIDILKRGWNHAVINEPLFFYNRRPVSMISESGKYHLQLFGDIQKLNREIY